jgi:very-short-patch-repair endonuclease
MRRNLHSTSTKDHERAGQLRHESSKFEQKLWCALREVSSAAQLKFRRQQPIHPYIADFACMKAKLIIELDGDSHDGRHIYDQARDDYLRKCGYTVLRIGNNEITTNLPGVVETIVMRAKALLPRNPLTKKI